MRLWLFGLGLMLLSAAVLAGCAPAATPTPAPTRAPASTPTKAADPVKPPAPTPTQPSAPSPTPKPAALKFGGIPSTAFAGIYVAIEKGYFKEQGITMEVVEFRTTPELIAPLTTSQLDVIGMPLQTPLLAAADRGIDLKVVAGGSVNTKGFDNSWIMLRKDLKDSGQVKSAADLKGMKVAISTAGSAFGEQAIEIMMAQAGASVKDVELVVLPFADQPAAFANKGIAASASNEPYITQAVQGGFAVKWVPQSEFFGGKAQGTLTMFGPTLLKDQDLGRRWMVAYLKGTRVYLKAFTRKEGRADIVDILVKYTPLKDPKLYDVTETPYFDPNGFLDNNSLAIQYKWLVGKGLYTGKTTLDGITDMSYVEYASQKLGKQ